MDDRPQDVSLDPYKARNIFKTLGANNRSPLLPLPDLWADAELYSVD